MADVGSAESVWYENISAKSGVFTIPVPQSGMYRIILVKVGKESSAELPKPKSARDYIGCCRENYNGCTSTAEIMKDDSRCSHRRVRNRERRAHHPQRGGLQDSLSDTDDLQSCFVSVMTTQSQTEELK